MRDGFEPVEEPDESEDWANKQFSKVLNYLSEAKLRYAGVVFLKWLAVPHVSLWKTQHTGDEKGFIWIMHNEFKTDHIIDREMDSERQALAYFGVLWQKQGMAIMESYKDREKDDAYADADTLFRNGRAFLGIADDEDLWQGIDVNEELMEA